MKRLQYFLPVAFTWLAFPAAAQFVQFDQPPILFSTTYERGINYRSLRGVPISNTVSTNGSDGRMPTTPTSGTANQFNSILSFGAVVSPPVANRSSLNTSQSYYQNAVNLGLNIGKSGSQVVMILRATQVGAPYFSRQVSFQFGQVVTPPETDEGGALITSMAASAYWTAEPYTTTGHTNASYYWSPHAQAVFAAQAGPVSVIWRKAQPSSTVPPGTLNENYVTISGLHYPITNASYVVSPSPVKTARQIYWTEGTFRATGKPVSVPAARVSAVKVAYNNAIPERVATEYLAPGQSQVATNGLSELRTLWYDYQQGQIFAYNREGRVFVELLGDSTGTDTRQHLGYEIVDITQVPVVTDITWDLGEKIGAYADGSSSAALNPEPIQGQAGQSFLYRHIVSGTSKVEYYAAQETANLNDVLVHWLEAGVQDLRWPLIYARYKLIWPVDVAKYSHYVRPLVATANEAKNTAVPLPTENVPVIQYQDPLDTPRGFLTETFGYYTFLDASQPVHRGLLRLTAGGNVAFERVFSWLDVNLKATNFADTVADTVAGDLAWVGDYVSARTRGVNGDWSLYVRDDANNTASGSMTSWEVVVVTSNSLTATLTTTSFASGSGLATPGSASSYLGNATPYPSTITVSGIKESVVKVQMKLNGLTHNVPSNFDIFLVGPNGTCTYLMSDNGGSVAISSVNLIFDDSAATALSSAAITSGNYRPSNSDTATDTYPPGFTTGTTLTSLDGLLLAAPTAPAVTGVNGFTAPRVLSQTADVGTRIAPPTDESGVQLVGYILQTNGTLFHPTAYKDPFVEGFDVANTGAIIPVNAIPGTNNLDIWWFRPSATNTVKNLINGFKSIYWPAVIGRYTLQWPSAPDEIVLASNDGSGPLASLQATGTIYTQNDPAKTGYNPNEEHALMTGGQAYALRDDLNLTNATVPAVLSGAEATYSSHPFVLLDYTDSDGRPNMHAFKVLREKPGAGIVFDYIVTAGGNQNVSGAGSILQAPMPLPLLQPPTEYVTNGTGISVVNYNSEPDENLGDLPANWSSLSASNKSTYASYKRFTYRDRKENFWVLRGLHGGLPALQAGRYNTNTKAFSTNLPAATAVVEETFTNTFHVSRQADSLLLALHTASPSLPDGLDINGLTVVGTPKASSSAATYIFTITDTGDGSSVTNWLSLNVAASGTVVAQGSLVITNTNFYSKAVMTYVGRPPFLANAATNTNCFTMRFYYKTQDGFAWPGDDTPPAIGSIVPYLRAAGSTEDPGAKTTAALDIVYRPVWPGDPPQLQFGETLMTPKNNLPAVRGQTSVQLLYQQAIAQTITTPKPAVVLHDPTREKSFELLTDSSKGLAKLPDGAETDSYQGKTYFPNLPPHLAERFYFDPNRGAAGALVFKGEYKDEALGEKYVLLNVLRGSDLASVKALCPDTDAVKADWDAAVDGLASTVETFYENPQVPGQFIVNPDLTTVNGVGTLTEITDGDTAVDSYALSASGPGQGYVTMIVGNGGAFTPAGDPVTVYVLKVKPTLFPGELKIIASANPLSEMSSFQHTADLAGRFDEYEYEWKIAAPVDGTPPLSDSTMSLYQALTNGLDVSRYTLGGSGIQALVDNYIVMRYQPKNTSHPLYETWSGWTEPQLAEGWIKRVLAGINPFGQRVTDLYNNTVNTDASILTSAGKRWEGDIALNMDTINDYGLIEIYETVLRRGRGLSIDAGINYGPANDALLLAAGYINDLYMLVGNEAYADAANPTIGIGTKDNTYGDIATSLFAFKGQVASLLEEELALLRGRDDFLQPGVDTTPVYNRFVWNYTRGIDAGEVIYALNYNILDKNSDGKVDASDAAVLYPQGHGDAYGHYLTALKGYYSLLMTKDFDWVPRTEAVTVLGKAVQVDYLDERKFASAASAVARTGRQVFDLTWRKDYQAGQDTGWEHFAGTRTNTSRTVTNGVSTADVVREWGADQWASRTAQGSFLNWVVGNAILPDVDPDPSHEGIQKIDRTTVPELTELVTTGDELQTALDNAEGRLTPLGLAAGSLAFDINPNNVVGANPQTHFEQIYSRAKSALNNAVVSFDDAKDVTRLMRSEEDSLADFAAGVTKQELAYTNALIELYGTPYTDDIGAGKTYKQGYAGPDLVHFAYVDLPELVFGGGNASTAVKIDIQSLPSDWTGNLYEDFNFVKKADDPDYGSANYIELNLGSHGYYDKPASWTGKRESPGKILQAISEFIAAHTAYASALSGAEGAKADLDRAIRAFEAKKSQMSTANSLQQQMDSLNDQIAEAQSTYDVLSKDLATALQVLTTAKDAIVEGLPTSTIFGLANGGDVLSPARAAVVITHSVSEAALLAGDAVSFRVLQGDMRNKQGKLLDLAKQMADAQISQDLRDSVTELGQLFGEVGGQVGGLIEKCRALDDADRKVRSLLAQGNRLQSEREIFRQRAAAVIQGFRTRDAAFRLFRNEKLERYKTLFDLASRYAYLAANAYDYETGLLGTDAGKSFVSRIINSRALGVVRGGEPQYAGSNTGDPGLSSALAEMKADWDVLKGRLGFNNPDAYGTTVSLRTEKLRILPGSDGDTTWQDVLQQGRMDNVLDDVDVRRYCLQIDPGTGLPVPGIVLTFSTTIALGQNLFGQPLAAGDNYFDVSAFATKLYAAGVALEGYRGMNNPVANGSAVTHAGGTSPEEPSSSYLDPLALASTPYIYLIPVGVDSMRSPPLGDTSDIRTWSVDDVAIPLPFNIGASDFSTRNLYQSADSLTEPLFELRKHQAFRPVSSTSAFQADVYGAGGSLQPSQFTNRRLIGRSVWNSQWKIVIPGNRLLNDPNEGLARFMKTVTDVKLYFLTYSYSGN